MNTGGAKLSKDKKEEIKEGIWTYVFAILLLIILIIVATQKSGWHVDEYCTFLLSNTSRGELSSLKSGDTYSGEEFFNKLFVVNDGTRFNVSNVFDNQVKDVHPPLYYLIVNMLCSIFSDADSLQVIGLGINIVLAVLCYFIFIKILDLFTNDNHVSVVISFLFCLSYAFLNTVMFMRMYMLLMLFTTLLIYTLLKYPPTAVRHPVGFYISLFLISVLGCLTHYYYIILFCSACFVYGILLIRCKKIKELVCGIFAAVSSLGVALLVFPAMYDHIFKGYRGTGSFEKAKSVEFISDLSEYIKIIDDYLFGGILLILLVCIIFALSLQDKVSFRNQNTDKYILLVVPAIISFLLVAKTAPYQKERYVSYIFFCFYFFVFILLYKIFRFYRKQAWISVLLIGIICLIGNLDCYPLTMQYKEEKINRDTIASLNCANTLCLYFYTNSKWKIRANCLELKELDEIIFYSSEDYADIDYGELEAYDNLILYIPSDGSVDSIVQTISEQSGKTSEQLFSFGYTKAFLFN